MKEFNLVLTPGVEDNDKIVLEFIREKYGDEMPWSFYSLQYVPPHIIKCFLLKIQGFSTFHISVNKPQSRIFRCIRY